jgi:DNA-binding IclR family transcriptional regulator
MVSSARRCRSSIQRAIVLAAVGVQGPLPRLTLEACRAFVPRMRQVAERIARVWFD